MTDKPVVARCGVDGCGQMVAWLQWVDEDNPSPARSIHRPGVSLHQRWNELSEDANAEWGGYVREGWLVGWCKRGGHGARFVKVDDLYAALDAGKRSVMAGPRP